MKRATKRWQRELNSISYLEKMLNAPIDARFNSQIYEVL